MKNNTNLTKLRCVGVNLINLINMCSINSINLINLNRVDSKTIEFSITDKDMKNFKSLDLRNYEITTISIGGVKKFLKTIYFRMGLIIGGIVAVLFLILTSNRYLNLHVTGLTTINNSEITSAIEEFGLKKYDKFNIKIRDLENYLAEKFDLSFVSIITKGNSLIISAKEELPEIQHYEPIISSYNMIINKINVYRGTSFIKPGDIVYKGDIIVEPYEIVNNERIYVEPCVEIEGDTYFSEMYEFKENEEVLIRTGKYTVIDSKINLGKINLFFTRYDHSYEKYEIIEKESYVTNYFIPIKIKKTIAYELTRDTKKHDFEKEKDYIISQLKEKLYKKVPKHLSIDNEEIKISQTNYGNIVTIYLKSSVYLKYNIN